jgi:hypothetical protein
MKRRRDPVKAYWIQTVYRDESKPTLNRKLHTTYRDLVTKARMAIQTDAAQEIDHILLLDGRADPNDPHRDYLLSDLQAASLLIQNP